STKLCKLEQFPSGKLVSGATDLCGVRTRRTYLPLKHYRLPASQQKLRETGRTGKKSPSPLSATGNIGRPDLLIEDGVAETIGASVHLGLKNRESTSIDIVAVTCAPVRLFCPTAPHFPGDVAATAINVINVAQSRYVKAPPQSHLCSVRAFLV